PAPSVYAQYKDREDKWQSQSPGHGLDANRAAIGRKSVGQGQHGEQAEYSGESSHLNFLFRGVAGFSDHAMNQWPFRRRSIADRYALREKLFSATQPRFLAEVDRRQRFAGLHTVPKFLVDNNPYGGIDGVFFPLSTASQEYADRANLLTLQGSDITGPGARDVHGVPRFRQPLYVVERSRIAALQFDHVPKLLQSLAGGDQFLRLLLSFCDRA